MAYCQRPSHRKPIYHRTAYPNTAPMPTPHFLPPKKTHSTIHHLPRDRPSIQRLPLVLLNLVQFLPPSRTDLDGFSPSKLVGTLHQPDRPITYVFPVHLFPRFEVVFRVGEGYEAVSCLQRRKETTQDENGDLGRNEETRGSPSCSTGP